MRRVRVRTEVLLAAACLAAALILGASELMDTFHLTPPGGEALLADSAFDRHHGAMLVLAAASVVALVVAGMTGSKPAAVSVAICGGIALLIFLVGDLPDANKIGTLDDARQSFIDAKAEPQSGFWFELIGALVLAVAGTALATMPEYRIKLFNREPDEGGSPRRIFGWSRSN
ncbi:MAG: hypothetical protein ABR536_06585 [Solirubrobacterales bacterium]